MLANETAREVQRLEAAGARGHGEFGDLILSSRTRQRVYIDGDVDAGIASLGPAGGFSDAVAPAAEIVARLMREDAGSAGIYADILRGVPSLRVVSNLRRRER
ncbi:Nitronate monooxygenase (fragment) [Cupriavidus necator]|uniref:Nitronate monooxygenase n=1 Tax=Cupriavidus necator TaxID=106590 RepID=A0A1K0JK49_CUPNE